MGNCFGCCKKNTRKFLLGRGSQEIPQDEEFMELEQRTAGINEMPTSNGEVTTEITKPSKLKFKKPRFGWLRNENQMLSSTLQHFKNMKSPADSVMPLLNRENSFAETCSNTGSQKWDQLSLGATPGSSVDLEWENEIGFNSTSNMGANEELQWTVLTENTNNSWRSSPLSNSNGLEWDGDYISSGVDVSEIVAETQRLTANLEDNIGLDTSKIDMENNN